MSIGQLAVDKTDEELKGHTLDSAFSILGEQGWELCGSTGPIIRMLQPHFSTISVVLSKFQYVPSSRYGSGDTQIFC